MSTQLPLLRRLLAGIAALTVVAAVATGCSNDDGASAADAAVGSTTTAPVDGGATTTTTMPEPVGEPVTRYSLNLGDCFNVYNALHVITRVACDQPHDREVFHAETHPAPHGEPYPGERAMQRYAMQVCYRQFEAFTGGIYELSALEIGAFTPTQKNFEDAKARYRGITCWLHGRGSQLTGSVYGLGL